MSDALFLGLVVLFFVLSIGLLHALDSLQEDQK